MLGQSLRDYWGRLSVGKQWYIGTQRTEWHQYMKSLLSLGLCSDVKLLSVFRFSSSLLWCLQPPCFLLKKTPPEPPAQPSKPHYRADVWGMFLQQTEDVHQKPQHHDIRDPELTDKRWQRGAESPCGCLGKLLAPRSSSRKLILAILAEMITHICSRNGSMYFKQVCRKCGARAAGGEVWPR